MTTAPAEPDTQITQQRYKQFMADYREAWRRWCAGVREVVFPTGTYLIARRFDVAVAET